MTEEHTNHERREILIQGAALAGLALGGTILPGLITGCENDTVKSSNKSFEFDISTESALVVTGGAVKKTFGENNGGKPVIIIRSGEKSFVVFSSVCTHQGCFVNLPASPGGDLICPCHGSIFLSSNGSVRTGPATSPLKQFTSTFDTKTNILSINF